MESMLRVHLMQNWFALSDPAMEEALYEIAPQRAVGRLSLGKPIPDEMTILNFRHLLETNDLAEDILKAVNAHLAKKGLLLKRGSIVDATRNPHPPMKICYIFDLEAVTSRLASGCPRLPLSTQSCRSMWASCRLGADGDPWR